MSSGRPAPGTDGARYTNLKRARRLGQVELDRRGSRRERLARVMLAVGAAIAVAAVVYAVTVH